jgi:hypothetical protein
MSTIEVLDSSQIRFGSIDPVNGQYTLIGDYSFNNLYTLAGNSIDPYQMIYYYSDVDTLIGIDLYDGSLYTEIPIQMQPFGIFENIAYSCADTSIYGLSRQNFTSSVFDSLIMEYVEVVDSITFRLTKIDPNTGVVTFISPYNIQVSGNLTGGSYIDPNSMTYYFKNGNNIVGISLITGLIMSSVLKTFPSGEVSIDMMRSSLNCYGATKIRPNPLLGVVNEPKHNLTMSPNPAQTEITFHATMSIEMITVIDFLGNYLLTSANNSIDVSNLPEGIYFAKVHMQDGVISTQKFIKN